MTVTFYMGRLKKDDVYCDYKFFAPQLQPGLLRRRHLIERLNKGLDKRVTVISGMAGSGKTTLALQWIEEAGLNTVWYSLEKSDDEGDLFIRYFLGAISRIDDRCSEIVRPTLAFQDGITQDHVSRLLEDCGRPLSSPVYLVLDDFHYITNTVSHDALSHVLKYAPPQLRFVIISRNSMPVTIASVRIRNQITEITAENLKFSTVESKRLFDQILPLPIPKEHVEEINHSLEGWIGGLRLFGMYLEREKRWDQHHLIFDKALQDAMLILLDQVVDAQPAKTRAFIQKTAILERFNAELCQEVTQERNAASILADMVTHNLFITAVDSRQTWFRYHKLLSDAMESKLRRNSNDAFQEIHRKAARWFAEQDALEDAFRHAFASEDMEFIGDFLEAYLRVLFNRYEIAAFKRWLTKYPYHLLQRRPLLLLFDCRYKLESLELLEARAIIERFEAHPELFERYCESKKHLCQDYLIFLQCQYQFWKDSLSVDVEAHHQRIVAIHPENKILRDHIKVDIAASHYLKGEMAKAKLALEEVSSDILHSESGLTKMVWFRMRIAMERQMGRLERANTLLGEAYDHIDRIGLAGAPIKSMLNFEIAWIYYSRNQLDEAEKLAVEGLTYLRRNGGYIREQIEAGFLAALIQFCKRDMDAAKAHARKIQEISRSADNLYAHQMGFALFARLSVMFGELSRAESWAKNRALSPTEPFSFRYIHECLAVGELLLALSRPEEVTRLLENPRQLCETNEWVEARLEIDLLRSIALYNANELEASRLLFAQVFIQATEEGYITLFSRRADSIKPLLTELYDAQGRHKPVSDYSRGIFTACGLTENVASELTKREVEILILLSKGDKYKEIANQLHISIDTVRTHIRHLYSKLGVNSSFSAIDKARSLRVLPRSDFQGTV